MRTYISLIIFFLFSALATAQSLTSFSFSECISSSEKASQSSVEVFRKDEITNISFGALAPCNGNLKGDLNWKFDSLNLTFKVRPTVYKKKGGSTNEVLEIAECDCYFRFQYEISGLVQVDSSKLLVNGEPINIVSKKISAIDPELDPDIEITEETIIEVITLDSVGND